MRLKPLPDPHAHASQHVHRLTKRYLRQARRAGIEPDTELAQLIVERAGREAAAHFDNELTQIHLHNLLVTHKEHHKRMKTLLREHATKWKTMLKNHRHQLYQIRHQCRRPFRVWSLLLAVFFGILALSGFMLTSDLLGATCAGTGTLTCLAMLLLEVL